MAAEQGLQQLKSARARESICNAAIGLLAKVGYAETTIAGVAQEAGFSKGAAQYHFRTEEEPMAAPVDHLLIRPVSSASHRHELAQRPPMHAGPRQPTTGA